jgi:YesN/AraC family two-component response regulator
MRMILRTASCAAAISVSRHGAAPSIPVRSEVTSLLDSMKIKETDRSKLRQSKIISAFIDRNLSSITLEALANHLGYSSVYTGSLVKRVFGVPFTRLVLDKRLEVAKRLLCETDMPVGEIIKSLGYENENYFREKFKEKYKKNPLEYRRKVNSK